MMDFWFSQLETEDVKTSIRVNKQLYSAQSEYQRIDVFERNSPGTAYLQADNVIIFCR